MDIIKRTFILFDYFVFWFISFGHLSRSFFSIHPSSTHLNRYQRRSWKCWFVHVHLYFRLKWVVYFCCHHQWIFLLMKSISYWSNGWFCSPWFVWAFGMEHCLMENDGFLLIEEKSFLLQLILFISFISNFFLFLFFSSESINKMKGKGLRMGVQSNKNRMTVVEAKLDQIWLTVQKIKALWQYCISI